ncbi:MAG: beta-galactosidase [Phycisphaerae bacterium]|nr:beta-galactosidase [Phycisphaerae bacterium]
MGVDRHRIPGRLTLIACLASTTAAFAGAVVTDPRIPLFAFDAPDALQGFTRNNVDVELVNAPSGQGKALKVLFKKADWPNVFFPAGDKPWDWSSYLGLAVDVTNPNPFDVQVAMRVDNKGADGAKNCNQENFTAKANKTTTIAIAFNYGLDLGLWGMRGYPPPSRGDGTTLDPSRVVAFQVFLPMPNKPKTLILDNIRLFGKRPKLEPWPSKAFVDRFGQFRYADWPGKLKDASEFKTRLAAERTDIARHPAPKDRDEYGGWKDGPKLTATGWFRTEKVDGKWWLVTPSGHLFFSLGVDCVGHWAQTIVTQRDDWFEWLPEPDGEFGQHYGTFANPHRGPVKKGKTFGFYSANLQRKYAKSWQEDWREMVWKRLPSWGLNTIANWSQHDTFTGPIPYVASVGIGGKHARVSSGSDYWSKMHDVFDPEFAADVAKAVNGGAHLWKDKKMCLGVFVDNELSWGHERNFGLAVGPLNCNAGQPSKKAILEDLRKKYETIDKLNAAWKTTWPSWDEMSEKPAAPNLDKATDECKKDLDAFIRRFSLKYFSTIRDAIRKTSPHHLYLGCRFAWGNQTSYRAAAEVCDVVSFNIYRETVDPEDYGFTNDLNKPCIIGEFHFGALDRGMFHTGLVKAKDQADRARKYAAYVRSVADMPAFVGCHWFQFVDEPITGRWFDGENYNIGFVTVTDDPYPELIAAARQVHAEIYQRRAGKK